MKGSRGSQVTGGRSRVGGWSGPGTLMKEENRRRSMKTQSRLQGGGEEAALSGSLSSLQGSILYLSSVLENPRNPVISSGLLLQLPWEEVILDLCPWEEPLRPYPRQLSFGWTGDGEWAAQFAPT